MSSCLIPALVLCAAVAAAADEPHAGPAALSQVLARMDRAAVGFKSLTASVRRVTHTDFVNEDTVDVGTIKFKRGTKPHDTHVLIDFTKPDPKTLVFQGKKLEIYYPRMKLVDEYDLGKYRDLVDQFILLGFGTTSKELLEDYNIRLIGPATVSSAKATEIELIPKSKEVMQQVKRFELWIADSNGLPVQLKYYPSGQNILITYTDINVNVNLPDADLKLHVDKSVKRAYPQKGS